MPVIGPNPYGALSLSKTAGAGAMQAKPKPEGNPITEGVQDFKTAMKEAEQAAMNTAVSGADPHAMVEALANAELVLDAAVTVRDKVVEAYQELLRMPV